MDSNLHPVMAAALSPFVEAARRNAADPRVVIVPAPATPEVSEVDRAIRLLDLKARRLTDRQLSDLADVFREALCSAEDGEVCRHFDSDGLDDVLAQSRAFDPNPEPAFDEWDLQP